MSELEICCHCDGPTGRAGKGEDSLYLGDWGGPFCEECYDDQIAELADAYGVVKVQAKSLREQLAASEARVAELENMLSAIDDLMGDSVGVAGLHLNGDIATWDWLKNNNWLEAQEWVPVSERLPRDFEIVLVRGGAGYIERGVWKSYMGRDSSERPIAWEVTHWMTLPTPPTDKGDG